MYYGVAGCMEACVAFSSTHTRLLSKQHELYVKNHMNSWWDGPVDGLIWWVK